MESYVRNQELPDAYGLWTSVRVASRHGWGVHLYHDGSVEHVLQRFREAFPAMHLRCIRVELAPDLRGRSYIGCLFRLLAADDPNVDTWLSRDLDDPLDAAGLRMVTERWLHQRPNSDVHYQRERYDTPFRRSMVNMGWYGQRNVSSVEESISMSRRPSVSDAIAAYLRERPIAETDRYTADEEFLTDVWIPLLRKSGFAHRITRLPSHPYRRKGCAPSRRPRAWQQFLKIRVKSIGNPKYRDSIVYLGYPPS